jgi:hypothetical protein
MSILYKVFAFTVLNPADLAHFMIQAERWELLLKFQVVPWINISSITVNYFKM